MSRIVTAPIALVISACTGAGGGVIATLANDAQQQRMEHTMAADHTEGSAELSLLAVTAIPSPITRKGGRGWLNNGRRAKTERIKSYRSCWDAGRLQC